ncbi:unnamed protein product [Eruca vesicaria subsp. sativa]|uniref:Uncharacterized protein n=1 Tax=Eruca vesicaria subsp. sativa TaxID=29727 RepID=A0ABC8IRP5_ERUVS|nr:unnamed protein product [Eruca vesicaria subsp. sativa]
MFWVRPLQLHFVVFFLLFLFTPAFVFGNKSNRSLHCLSPPMAIIGFHHVCSAPLVNFVAVLLLHLDATPSFLFVATTSPLLVAAPPFQSVCSRSVMTECELFGSTWPSIAVIRPLPPSCLSPSPVRVTPGQEGVPPPHCFVITTDRRKNLNTLSSAVASTSALRITTEEALNGRSSLTGYFISSSAGASSRLPVVIIHLHVTASEIWISVGQAHLLVAGSPSSKPIKLSKYSKFSWVRALSYMGLYPNSKAHNAHVHGLCISLQCDLISVSPDSTNCNPSKAVPSTTLCVVLLRQPSCTSLQGRKILISSKTVFNCSQNPLTGFFNVVFDFFVFFRTRALGLQVKIFYGFLLSLATSIFYYVLAMLAYLSTGDYLSVCNRVSPLDF